MVLILLSCIQNGLRWGCPVRKCIRTLLSLSTVFRRYIRRIYTIAPSGNVFRKLHLLSRSVRKKVSWLSCPEGQWDKVYVCCISGYWVSCPDSLTGLTVSLCTLPDKTTSVLSGSVYQDTGCQSRWRAVSFSHRRAVQAGTTY